MTDFLLELRSEEIPARMQAAARDNLAKLFAAEIAKAGLAATETQTYATPRRLALIARGLPDATQAVSEELKGPRTTAPDQALDGFLRKTGLTRDQLVDRDGIWFAVIDKPGRATADVIAEAIPAIVRAFPWPKSMRWGDASLSTESLRWVRPLQGVVALFGEDIVPVEIAGITSGATTVGHRFHHPGAITIGSAADYAEKLRACHVIVDHDERAALIRDRATALASEAGLELIADEGLVAENAGLTEWPVPLLDHFDEAFLDVPPEVIQLTARVNQKYFVCRSADGKLANVFICTANIAAADGGAKIVEGNRKVLAARLADARFFYETDLKVPLEEQAKKLEKIVFHEKLGTLADKVDRVAKLARWLVEEGIVTENSSPERGGGPLGDSRVVEGQPSSAPPAAAPPPPAGAVGPPPFAGEDLASLATRAARLAKADLVTGMVGEFPELQGVMGGYYAAAQGEDPAIAAAIRDHYKPVGQGDEVPADPVTVAVSLADKLDTIFGFFVVGERPTGTRDPFALRRAALGLLSLIVEGNVRPDLYDGMADLFESLLDQTSRQNRLFTFDGGDREGDLITTSFDASRDAVAFIREWFVKYGRARDPYRGNDDEMAYLTGPDAAVPWPTFPIVSKQVFDFLVDRLKVQQREAGVRHDLIDAVFALGGEDDLVRLLARVRALQSFIGTADGTNLLAGYKRAANILKKEGYAVGEPQPAPLPDFREGLGVGAERSEAPAAASERDPSGRAPTPDPSVKSGRGEKPLSYTPEIAEAALIAALDAAEPAAASAVAAEDFEGAMAALATLRAPIDAFFEGVTVNDPDQVKRAARLALLARVRAAVHNVADFSKIEG